MNSDQTLTLTVPTTVTLTNPDHPDHPDSPGEGLGLIPGARWYAVDRADPRLYALYKRHYSYQKGAKWRRPGNTECSGPGSPLCLLTVPGDAGFIWLKNTAERYDGQTGIACTLFRNEGPYRASELILEAEQLAWQRWPGARLFTYVDPRRVRTANPGYVFLRARWKRVGESKSGLLLFEKRSR